MRRRARGTRPARSAASAMKPTSRRADDRAHVAGGNHERQGARVPRPIGPPRGPERERDHRTETEADDPERDDGRDESMDDQQHAERDGRAGRADTDDGRLPETGHETIPDETGSGHPGRESHDPQPGGARGGAHGLAQEDGAPFDRDPLDQEGCAGHHAQEKDEMPWARSPTDDVRPDDRFRRPGPSSSAAGSHRRSAKLATRTSADASGRWIAIGIPAAIPAEASPAPTNRATLQVPWIAVMIRRPNRRSTATASMFIATSRSPARRPIAKKIKVNDPRPAAAGRRANPMPIPGMPARTTRRPPHRRTVGPAARVPTSRPTAKPVSAIPNPPASIPVRSLRCGTHGPSRPDSTACAANAAVTAIRAIRSARGSSPDVVIERVWRRYP